MKEVIKKTAIIKLTLINRKLVCFRISKIFNHIIKKSKD